MGPDGSLRWGVNAQVVLQTGWEDRELLMTLTPNGGSWIVIAIQTVRTTSKVLSSAQDIEAALSGHAHHTLGVYASLAEATSRSESYASGWLAARGGKVCECGPVGV